MTTTFDPEADEDGLPAELTSSGAAALLDAVCERMIPPTTRWPSAGALGLGSALSLHLRESEWTAVEVALGRLGPGREFLALGGSEQDARIRRLEEQHPHDFKVLRQVIYLGYYAQPAVVDVLRAMGFDINHAPQPHGYSMPPTSPDRVEAVRTAGRGVWIPTEKVVRVRPQEVRP